MFTQTALRVHFFRKAVRGRRKAFRAIGWKHETPDGKHEFFSLANLTFLSFSHSSLARLFPIGEDHFHFSTCKICSVWVRISIETRRKVSWSNSQSEKKKKKSKIRSRRNFFKDFPSKKINGDDKLPEKLRKIYDRLESNSRVYINLIKNKKSCDQKLF